MSNVKLENIYKECPKTFEMYKKYLIDKYKDVKEGSGIEAFLTDNMLQLNIKTAPMALTYFFDTLDLVGTLYYSVSEKEFQCMVNEEPIDVEENQQWNEDRAEAEAILIKYLFIETEKTL